MTPILEILSIFAIQGLVTTSSITTSSSSGTRNPCNSQRRGWTEGTYPIEYPSLHLLPLTIIARAQRDEGASLPPFIAGDAATREDDEDEGERRAAAGSNSNPISLILLFVQDVCVPDAHAPATSAIHLLPPPSR